MSTQGNCTESLCKSCGCDSRPLWDIVVSALSTLFVYGAANLDEVGLQAGFNLGFAWACLHQGLLLLGMPHNGYRFALEGLTRVWWANSPKKSIERASISVMMNCPIFIEIPAADQVALATSWLTDRSISTVDHQEMDSYHPLELPPRSPPESSHASPQSNPAPSRSTKTPSCDADHDQPSKRIEDAGGVHIEDPSEQIATSSLPSGSSHASANLPSHSNHFVCDVTDQTEARAADQPSVSHQHSPPSKRIEDAEGAHMDEPSEHITGSDLPSESRFASDLRDVADKTVAYGDDQAPVFHQQPSPSNWRDDAEGRERQVEIQDALASEKEDTTLAKDQINGTIGSTDKKLYIKLITLRRFSKDLWISRNERPVRKALLDLRFVPEDAHLQYLCSQSSFQTMVTLAQTFGNLLSVGQRRVAHLPMSPLESLLVFFSLIIIQQLAMGVYACVNYKRPLLLRLKPEQFSSFYNHETLQNKDALPPEMPMRPITILIISLFTSFSIILASYNYYYSTYFHIHCPLCSIFAILFYLITPVSSMIVFIEVLCIPFGEWKLVLFYIVVVSNSLVCISSIVLSLLATFQKWELFKTRSPSVFAWILPHVSSW